MTRTSAGQIWSRNVIIVIILIIIIVTVIIKMNQLD